MQVGKSYLIRTVGAIWAGELVAIDYTAGMLTLNNAAWIADTGRYSECLANGTCEEVEPVPDDTPAGVMLSAIVDWAEWRHPLPREVK